MDSEMVYQFRDARDIAIGNLLDWEPKLSNDEVYIRLIELIGFRSNDTLTIFDSDNSSNDPALHWLPKLAGPNGYAIYKLLLAQRGIKNP